MSGTASIGVGDIITRGGQRGQIIGGKKGSWTVAMFDDKGKLGSPSSGVADAELTRAGYKAFMSVSGIGPVLETALNSLVYAVIQKVRKSSSTFGPR